MSTTKTYLLVPHHDFSAEGPLVLGSIIADPSDPGEILHDEDTVEITSSGNRSTHKYDWDQIFDLTDRGQIGVWARFVNSWLGGNLGGSVDTKAFKHYRIEHLETVDFSPSQDYVENSIRKSSVKAYLEGSRYTLPVYMVTGLKLARGPGSQVISRKYAVREGHANVGISGFTMPGGAVTFDAGDMSIHQVRNEENSFRGSDFVVAYRLSKITVRKDLEQIVVAKNEKYTAGAMLGAETNERVYPDLDPSLNVTIEGEGAVECELPTDEIVTAVDERGIESCQCFIVPAVI